MFRFIRFACVLGVLGAAAAVPACGSDDPEKTVDVYDTGLKKDLSLDQLSDSEAQTLCDTLGDFLESDPQLRKAACHSAGVGAALFASLFGRDEDTMRKVCADTETACMAAPTSTGDAGGSTCTKPPGPCTATVAEFEACVSDAMHAASASLESLPKCSTISKDDIGSLSPSDGGAPVNQVPEPESCKVLDQKCPAARSSTGVAGATSGS